MVKKNKNDLISVIVPVYNGSAYLPDLIKNLAHQTHKNIEVLMVDDLSTDNSSKIIESWANQDKRFKLIKRKTKGGTAIKGIVYALPYCTGQYFFFMSQDDLIDTDTLEKLYNRAVESGADIVVPNMDWFYGDGVSHGGLYYDSNTELTGTEAFFKSLNWDLHGFNLRKMDFAKKIGWDDLYYNSCEYATRIHYFYANKVVFCDTKFYYRQNNPQSITKTKIAPFKMEVMQNHLRLLNFMLSHNLQKTKNFKSFFSALFKDYEHFSSYAVFRQLSDTEKQSACKILHSVRMGALRTAIKSKQIKFIKRALRIFFKTPGVMTRKTKRELKT